MTHKASLARSHLVETYDLIQRDQCWHPEIITHPRFAEFVREVKHCFVLFEASKMSRFVAPIHGPHSLSPMQAISRSADRHADASDRIFPSPIAIPSTGA
jgi:hypothetical protein